MPLKNPTVSVLLPVYNAERHIQKAVESVLGQTYSDFELLVIDDGSNDRSSFVLQRLAANDERMLLRRRDNRGLVTTLNELIDWSCGVYLARMDADDICRQNRFERQLAYLNQHPECVAVGSAITLIDPEGMPIRDFAHELTHTKIDAAHLSGVNQSRISHPSVMMRKDGVVRVGKYREEYLFAEDLDLFLRLAEDGGKLANVPEILLEYRHQVTSVCYANYEKQRQVAKQAVEAARARRGISHSTPLMEPDTKFESSGDVHRKWAWWALSGGNLRTARKHAVKAVLREPWNIENLRALACAIRGY